MSVLVYNDAHFSFDGNDLSSYVRSLELTVEVATAPDTTMGDTTDSEIGTLLSWAINPTMLQDFDAAGLDSILFPLLGQVGAIEIRPKSDAVGTSNPKFTANGLLKSYPILGGSVGDVVETGINIVPSKGAGSATLVRATS